MTNVRIWDLPTRLFHWTLALCVVALVITGNIGGEAMVWHFRLGFTVLSLLLFRLVWGFCGGHWSRWSNLPIHPRTLMAYLRSPPSSVQAGHNPLGSLSVLALLLMLLFQVASGLISDDEIATAGPFVPWVSSSLSAMATHWHTSKGKTILLLLIALHLAAIWFTVGSRNKHSHKPWCWVISCFLVHRPLLGTMRILGCLPCCCFACAPHLCLSFHNKRHEDLHRGFQGFLALSKPVNFVLISF